MKEKEHFVKVGFFGRGRLDFIIPPDLISYDEVLQKLFERAFSSVIEVDSVGEEYAQLSQIHCDCGGVFWPTEVFVAISRGEESYDLLVAICLICNKDKHFLFNVTEFYKKEKDLSDEEREEFKEEAQRGKEMLNTEGFHVLTMSVTGKDMIENEHTREYFDLRDQFDWAGEASIILREEGLLRKKS